MQNLFLILGHFEKTRMFFQSAFASNKSVSLSLSSGVQETQSLQKLFHATIDCCLDFFVHTYYNERLI